MAGETDEHQTDKKVLHVPSVKQIPLLRQRAFVGGRPLCPLATLARMRPAPAPSPCRLHHHVYVVELAKEVLQERKFRKANPGYVNGKPCVYVGMTGLDPDTRFDRHKAGIQANSYVMRYGLRLLPDLFEGFNPMRYADAVEREIEVAIDLRSAGFGVWQA
jgi:predicted GIY-YIG superfamily endonuclease